MPNAILNYVHITLLESIKLNSILKIYSICFVYRINKMFQELWPREKRTVNELLFTLTMK